jgi:O-antigen/teichoic acid export membrane protein
MIVLVVWASGVLGHILLSDRFARAGPLLILLSLQAFATSLVMPVQTLAIASGRPGHAARIVLGSVAMSLALTVVLVPRDVLGWPMLGMGAEGAAIAALASTVFALLLYQVPSRQWPGHSLQRHLGLHVLAALLVLGALFLVRLPQPTRFLQLPLYAAGIAGAYGLVLSLVGELRRDDGRRLLALLAPQTAKKP